MSRTVPEWIGKTDDATIPPRVRLRVFERWMGVCHISGRKILPHEQWDLDHIVSLVNGGKHVESNLAPALRDKHRIKTKSDVAEKAMMARKRKKAVGIKRPSSFRGWRKFSGQVVFNKKTPRPW